MDQQINAVHHLITLKEDTPCQLLSLPVSLIRSLCTIKKNSEYKYFVIDTLTHIQKPVEMCIMFEINKKHV